MTRQRTCSCTATPNGSSASPARPPRHEPVPDQIS
jgi:hypothetical protein